MKKRYLIRLGKKQIGITYFEDADPPMGVVMGKIIFDEVVSPYQLFSKYCKENDIPVNEDDPKQDAIFTQSIDELKVFTEDGIEVKGIGAAVYGFKYEGYYIAVFGIAYPFYGEEFPHHCDRYDKQFK